MKKVKKTPVTLQMEAAECGAACLSMILAYHGRFVPLERLRIECGVSRDGINAKSIILAAELHNLKASAYSRDIDELAGMTLPAIIHWKFNHFVVLCGFSKKSVLINDPAVGRIAVSHDEFDKSFTGIILCFEKREGFEKTDRQKNMLFRRIIKENFESLIFILLISFVLSAVSIVIPIFSQLFINYVLLGHNKDALNPIILSMVIALFVMTAASMLRIKYLMKLKAKLALVSSAGFMWKIMSLPIEFFSQRFAGELAARQTANEKIADIFCSRVVPVAVNIVMLAIYFSVLLSYNSGIAILGALAAFINAAIVLFTSGMRKNLAQRLQRDLGQYEGNVASGIDMIETIMACGSEDGFFEKWTGYAGKAVNSKAEIAQKSLYINAAPAFLASAINAAVIMYGANEILKGHLTVGSLIALQGFLTLFLSPINELVESATSIQSAGGYIGRLKDTQNYPVNHMHGEDMTPLTAIKIENLTFSYNPLSEPIIKDLSLEIKEGCQVALTGKSGCGKSTVSKLVAGLYEPLGGRILFGDKTIEQIDADLFYSSVAVVDQEIALFEGTVMDNITMWDKSISHNDAVQAAKDACIHDDIMTRPGGYFSPVSVEGQNFSGGQKQRIEIARALAKNPSILIMDEATSALDAHTEAMVMRAVKNKGITCLIIAHRLSAVRDCDEIIVLEKGEIIQRGTHDDLVNNAGVFSHCFHDDTSN